MRGVQDGGVASDTVGCLCDVTLGMPGRQLSAPLMRAVVTALSCQDTQGRGAPKGRGCREQPCMGSLGRGESGVAE